ncbi:MAG TPA: DUF1273 domain-containing protein, partial [Ruminococcus flavefaciens]|nr:DUF1273 domain-containing protein [Ruminococcus flavefaciens]
FFAVHADSDHVELISNQYTEDCYELADEHMIDESDLVVIVGSPDQNNSLRKYAEITGVKVEYFPL